MSDITSYLRSLERSRDSLRRENRPETFMLRGREWDLLPTVFSPVHSGTTEIVLEALGLSADPARPWSGSFLEIGCGTGVVAVTAALAGCERVTASDIHHEAVDNAARNARRHGVADRVTAVHSDLFDALPEGLRFDTVVWSSPYVRAPADYAYRSPHERAYVDPGYRAHRRFLTGVTARLAPGGRALLHFSSRGDLAGLRELAEETGRELSVRTTHRLEDRGDVVEHMLIEVRAAGDGSPT